jgi:hypothetical protein
MVDGFGMGRGSAAHHNKMRIPYLNGKTEAILK